MTKKDLWGSFIKKIENLLCQTTGLSEIDVKAILTNKKSSLLKGLKSKTGKTFDAYIVLIEDGSTEFEFPPRTKMKK